MEGGSTRVWRFAAISVRRCIERLLLVGDTLNRPYSFLPWFAAIVGIVACAWAAIRPIEIPRQEPLSLPTAPIDQKPVDPRAQDLARFRPLWKVRLFSPVPAKPREPVEIVNSQSVSSPPPKPPLVLKSILHSPKSRIAIFSQDGLPGAVRLSEGQAAAGVEVRRIEPGFVELIFQGQTSVMPLAAPQVNQQGK